MYDVFGEVGNRPSPSEQIARNQNEESEISESFPGQIWTNTERHLGFRILTELDRCTIAQEVHALQHSLNDVICNGSLSDDIILDMITSADPNTLKVSEIPSTWTSLAKADRHIETRPIVARVLTALSLKAHSDMWTWFSRHVTKPVVYLSNIPIASLEKENLQTTMPNNWIFSLFLKVRTQLLLKINIHLVASEFFEGSTAPDYTYAHTQESRILSLIEAAVAQWLQFHPFPAMSLTTSRAVATFISKACMAFKSTDFLYLSYIQNRIKTLRASLTNEKTDLTKVPWERLAEELAMHPLASPRSDEAIALKRLKNLLWVSSGLRHPHPMSSEMAEMAKEVQEYRKDGDGGALPVMLHLV
jgi:hypothetical protein